jgi:glycosyltransferase involved in cell wall biosynthesis
MPLSLLVAHWGRLGAGPRITARLAESLTEVPGVRVTASVEARADSIPRLPARDLVTVTTYTRRWEIIGRLPRLIRLSLETRRLLRDRRIDVYFSPMMSIWGALGVFLIVPRRVTAVITVHDADQHPGDRHPVLELCRRLEMARADIVVAFSQHSADAIRRRISPRKAVIWVPHGTDADPAVRPRPAPVGSPVVGFFGRITEYKGIDVYVDAIEIVRRSRPDVRGRVVGNGDVDEALIRRSAEGIDWRVGWVEESEVEEVVDGFDLVVLPYQEASQSGVLPLAASRGVPVVATPIGGLVEQAAASGNALLTESSTAESVAASILALLADPATYGRLSAAGIASAAGETEWHAVAQRLAAEIEAARR